MGEGINLRRSGKQKKLPVLNANYPADVTVEYNGNATFEVEIVEHGYPEEYTYQWYLDGEAVSSATNPSFTIYTNASSVGTHPIRCDVTNKAGTVQSRNATLTVGTALPNYTFSGSHLLVDDGSGNWRILLKSTGTLKFTNRGTGVNGMDIYCLGGGAGGDGGGWNYSGGSGGGGGYTTNTYGVAIANKTNYACRIGAGGGGGTGGNLNYNSAGAGGTTEVLVHDTSAVVARASGGNAGVISGYYGDGGAGGSGGGGAGYSNGTAGKGGYNGGAGGTCTNGSRGNYGGAGQGSTTGEFGSSVNAARGAGGGGGAGVSSGGTAGTAASGGSSWAGAGGATSTGGSAQANTGCGGGGGGCKSSGNGGSGGSGIVIIRNKR